MVTKHHHVNRLIKKKELSCVAFSPFMFKIFPKMYNFRLPPSSYFLCNLLKCQLCLELRGDKISSLDMPWAWCFCGLCEHCIYLERSLFHEQRHETDSHEHNLECKCRVKRGETSCSIWEEELSLAASLYRYTSGQLLAKKYLKHESQTFLFLWEKMWGSLLDLTSLALFEKIWQDLNWLINNSLISCNFCCKTF